jgi:DNA-binding NarL/FixJ family response regulator
MTGQRSTILFVDDDAGIMQCVGAFLERHEMLEVVGYASHAQAGVAMAVEKRPDVVLHDIHMLGADPFWSCQEIVKQTNDRTKVLFYTGFPRDQYLDRCIAAGASGMVSKHSETILNLGLAIRYVLKGNTYYSPELARRLIELESGAPHSRLSTLTHREVDVLRQLACGKINREIADALDISLRSVEKEVADLKEKLELKTINELLIFAANEGIIYPELVLRG